MAQVFTETESEKLGVPFRDHYLYARIKRIDVLIVFCHSQL